MQQFKKIDDEASVDNRQDMAVDANDSAKSRNQRSKRKRSNVKRPKPPKVNDLIDSDRHVTFFIGDGFNNQTMKNNMSVGGFSSAIKFFMKAYENCDKKKVRVQLFFFIFKKAKKK